MSSVEVMRWAVYGEYGVNVYDGSGGGGVVKRDGREVRNEKRNKTRRGAS